MLDIGRPGGPAFSTGKRPLCAGAGKVYTQSWTVNAKLRVYSQPTDAICSLCMQRPH